MNPRTMFEKIWEAHLVRPADADTPAILYVDLHLVHEVTSPQAFTWLRERGLKVRRPGQTVATMDHSTPTTPRGRDGKIPILDNAAAMQIAALEKNCADFGIELHALGTDGQGIVHVIGPELGVTQPGEVIVCGDSHTSTHGAFGALAFGIGTSEVSHVLATQSLLQQPPKTLAVTIEGTLRPGVTAKDLVLAVIARLGIGGGTGYVIEYRGSAIRALSMEERMTVCNMSIEAGARAGMIAPDETTFAYLKDRPRAPKGAAWDKAVAAWRQLPSDPGAAFDREEKFDAAKLEPMITYGTNPGMGIPIGGDIPALAGPQRREGARLHGAHRRQAAARAQGRRGVHRQLHQLAAVGPARGGRPSSRAARWPQACARWWCRARRRSRRRPRPRGSIACSSTPAPSGARPAARCASP